MTSAFHRRLGDAPDLPPLREQDGPRLRALGLTPDDLTWLARKFLGKTRDFVVRYPHRDRWQGNGARRLSYSELLHHLEGDRWIGTGARWDRMKGQQGQHVTDYFIVDLDHGPDLADRYGRVVGAFGAPGLVFWSSASRGLHVYYFLDSTVPLHLLRHPDAHGGGLLRDLLALHHLVERDGRLELYPRGTYNPRGLLGQHKTQNRVRLPFGRDSRLLDPDSLTPIQSGGGAADLRLVRRMFDGDKVATTSVAELEQRLGGPANRRARVARKVARRAHETGVKRLEQAGLTGPRQFNAAVMELCVHFRGSGLREDRTVARIVGWLDAHHNGQSRTYNRNPEEARAEIVRLVRRFYADWTPRQWQPLPGLSEWDVRRILSVTADDAACCDPATGAFLARGSARSSRAKLQQFLFDLLNTAKRWTLTQGQVEAERGASERLLLRSAAVRAFWPDPGEPTFIVDIPYEHRAKLNGCKRAKDRSALWAAAKATGLLTLAEDYDRKRRQAERYHVRLDFAEATFPSWDVAVGRILPEAMLADYYTEHQRRVIHRAMRKDAATIRPSRRRCAFEMILADYRTPLPMIALDRSA